MSGKKAVQIGQVFQLPGVDAHQRHLPIDVGIKFAGPVGDAKIAIHPYKTLSNLCRAPLDLEGLVEDRIRLLTVTVRLDECPRTQPKRCSHTEIWQNSEQSAVEELHCVGAG